MILDIEKYEAYAEAASRNIPVMLTIRQLMELTGFSHSCLAQWRMKNIGPKWLKFGKSVRYPLKDLIEYIQTGEQEPPEFSTVW